MKVPAEKAPPFAPHISADEALRMVAAGARSGASTRSRRSRCRCSPTRRSAAAASRRRSGRTTSMRTRFEQAVAVEARRRAMMAGDVDRREAQPVQAGVEPRAVPRGEAAGLDPGVRGRRDPDGRRGRRQILDGGEADMVGYRPAVLRRARPGRARARRRSRPLCRNSNLCVPAQMLGMKGVCYNPEVTRG